MKILIFSDIHGSTSLLDELIEHYSPDRIFGLGDFEVDEFILDLKDVVGVRGNSYFDPDYPIDRFIKINGINILLTHGHTHSVRGGVSSLVCFSKENGCDMAFYGHTHIAHLSKIDDMIVGNPGSLTLPYSPSYPTLIIMDIIEKNIDIKLINANTYEVIKEIKLEK